MKDGLNPKTDFPIGGITPKKLRFIILQVLEVKRCPKKIKHLRETCEMAMIILL